MKRLIVAALAISLVGLGACSNDKKDAEGSAAATSSTTGAGVAPTTAKGAVTTSTTKVPATTTTTELKRNDHLVEADAKTPTAGGCSYAAAGIGTVTLNPDVPSPRCLIMHDTDHLRVTNNMGVPVLVDDGAGGFYINQGETYSNVKAIGGYWAEGVHRLKISNKDTKAPLYGGSGPEVWLQS